MTGNEFSSQFDVLYNNVTSNQAAGLNEYEKAVFLTKAQDELIKNYFLPQSNPKQAGYDDNQKRQMDFSMLMMTSNTALTASGAVPATEGNYDPRGIDINMPEDVFLPINESLTLKEKSTGGIYSTKSQKQVIPLRYDEYTRLMSKPYKEPLKNQAWRLIVDVTTVAGSKGAEIIVNHNDLKWVTLAASGYQRDIFYDLRYVRKPKPIIIAPIDSYGMTIGGEDGNDTSLYTLDSTTMTIENPCELDDMMHEEILQRAVELAKVAWTTTGQDNMQPMMQAGQRSE